MTLTNSQTDELVNALFQCQCVCFDEERLGLFSRLPEVSKRFISSGSSLTQIRQFVEKCDDLNQLPRFIEEVRKLEGDGENFRGVKTIYDEMGQVVLLPSQRLLLKESIEALGLNASDLQPLVIECHPEASSSDIPRDVFGIIKLLSDRPHSAESGVMHLHPALEFIERIALKAQDPSRQKVKDKLLAMSEATAELFAVPPEFLESRRKKLEQTYRRPRPTLARSGRSQTRRRAGQGTA